MGTRQVFVCDCCNYEGPPSSAGIPVGWLVLRYTRSLSDGLGTTRSLDVCASCAKLPLAEVIKDGERRSEFQLLERSSRG